MAQYSRCCKMIAKGSTENKEHVAKDEGNATPKDKEMHYPGSVAPFYAFEQGPLPENQGY